MSKAAIFARTWDEGSIGPIVAANVPSEAVCLIFPLAFRAGAEMMAQL